MRRRQGWVAWYVRATLQRRIFFLIGATMLVSGAALMVVLRVAGYDVHAEHPRWPVMLLFVAVLWASSGRVARRLALPFVELARVAQEIGRGNLSARYVFGRRGRTNEAFLIGASINEMAQRIEKQLSDQRELLAAVSHEVRTPLARLRMLVELGRSRAATGGFVVDAKTLDDLDREVMEIDALMGELLASSRLDFAAINLAELDAADVMRRAVERQSLSVPVTVAPLPVPFRADPTLVQRALANLLHNAVVHGGGVESVVVTARANAVVFEVNDRGPGLPDGAGEKVFESFYRGAADGAAPAADHGALGLGLALVRRIAAAHGGRAFAKNRVDGPGATVGVELPTAGPAAPSAHAEG